MAIAAFGDTRTETHGGYKRETTGTGTFQRNQHLVEPEEGLQEQEIDSGTLEEPDLFSQ